MGMFDTVFLKCPKCEGEIEVQSKAGHCNLDGFSQDEVPFVIAADISGEDVYCHECGIRLVVTILPPENNVRVRLVRA